MGTTSRTVKPTRQLLRVCAFLVMLQCGTAGALAIEIEGTDRKSLANLKPLPGVINTPVFKANKEQPDKADGKGYTYHNHPDMACWKGKLYLAWSSCEMDEDIGTSRELYSTSTDGRTWTPPAELFPPGVSTTLRMHFFLAPNGRMLAIAGLRTSRDKYDKRQKGGIVVREILANHTLGDVYTLLGSGTVAETNIPETFTNSGGPFKTACQALLDDHVFLEQQDYGRLHEGKEMKWHDKDMWKNPKTEDYAMDFGRAMSFYRRKDGQWTGIGMTGLETTSADNGKNWAEPTRPPTLISGEDGRIWGQRTADARYALAYVPAPADRLPLVVVSGDDGTKFRDMGIVFNEDRPIRYPGRKKAQGAHDARGISEWANDGTRKEQVMWLAFSVNEEEICVSRIPLPIKVK